MTQHHYLLPARWIKRLPVLRNLIWILEAMILRSLIWVLGVVSLQRAYQVATFVCRILGPVFPFTPQIRRNFALAFPEKNEQEVMRFTRDACANIGRAVVDLVQAKRIWEEREKRIEFVTEEGVELSEIAGQAAVFVTAHVGAWQISSFVAAHHNLSMTSVYAVETNPHLHKLVDRLRSALPCRLVDRKGSMRHLMATLKHGNVIGLVSDLRLDGGESIPFFGVNTPSNTTAARLALHHGCELLPIRTERLPDYRFRITVCRPIRPLDPGASVDIQAKQMTQEQLGHFESWIREAPDQWLCVGRRWPREAYVASG